MAAPRDRLLTKTGKHKARTITRANILLMASESYPDKAIARSWRREISAWEKQRNSLAASVNWRFKTTDARRKMERLYPNA